MDKDVSDIFKSIDKLNPSGSILSDNTLSIVRDWIDTGSYALNAICSGSLYKGIPVGRITGLSGPTGSGKTLIMNKIMANAQKKGYYPVIWDSESAVDSDTAKSVGCDTTNMKYYPVETVEETRNQIAKFLDNVIEKNISQKFIIGLDSLGNLSSSKEINDVADDKGAMDMGARAKGIKSMMRVLTTKAAKAGVPIIFTNHIYANPAELYPSLIKTQSGGFGPLYLASLLIQLSLTQEKSDAKKKNDDDEEPTDNIIPIAHRVNGINLSAMTIKNRFVPPFLKTELYLNFKSGLSKYSGIKEIATAFGLLKAVGPSWELEGEKIGYAKSWENDINFWDTKILPKLEKILNEKLCYSQDIIKDLEKQINEIP
jgi:RecA/RadA recombinase